MKYTEFTGPARNQIMVIQPVAYNTVRSIVTQKKKKKIGEILAILKRSA